MPCPQVQQRKADTERTDIDAAEAILSPHFYFLVRGLYTHACINTNTDMQTSASDLSSSPLTSKGATPRVDTYSTCMYGYVCQCMYVGRQHIYVCQCLYMQVCMCTCAGACTTSDWPERGKVQQRPTLFHAGFRTRETFYLQGRMSLKRKTTAGRCTETIYPLVYSGLPKYLCLYMYVCM